MNKLNYILISGPTGVGKSTIISELKKKVPDVAIFSDPYIDNPFLRNAYLSKSKSFQSQLFFFKEFFKIHKQTLEQLKLSRYVIQERSIYESIEIFCENLFWEGLINQDELSLMRDLMSEVKEYLRVPDKIFFLDATAETIINRIHRRHRDFEANLTTDFIIRQQHLYFNWKQKISCEWNSDIITISTESASPQQISDEILTHL